MTDTNKERAEFEAWIPTIEGYPFARQFANLMWKSYQAGRAAKAPAAPTGWYALAADGMATLCVDRDDAEKTAAESEKEWPNCGPFRAVQLYTASPAPTEQWMPIESAPKTHKARLVWCPEYRNIYEVTWCEHKLAWIHFGHGDVMTDTATHWRDLPAPPQGAAKGAT